MSHEATVVYAVPTHLREREPFAFGRTVGEVAKLVVIGVVATQLASSNELPGMLRVPGAVAVLIFGAAWALVRIQHRTLDGWLGLACTYGARPRRQVWRSNGATLRIAEMRGDGDQKESQGGYELRRVRVRWAGAPAVGASSNRQHSDAASVLGGLA
jgi:hypothetical protein